MVDLFEAGMLGEKTKPEMRTASWVVKDEDTERRTIVSVGFGTCHLGL